MYRIDNATASVTLPAVTADGPKPDAFFTNGDPGTGTPATIVDAEWANMVQEEIAHVIEDSDGANTPLDKSSRTQLKEAILAFIAGKTSDYVLIQDQKSAGTDGGTFTSGAWRTRALNAEVVDTGNHASVATNQITLDPGTYRFRITAPSCGCQSVRSRLQNISDSATVAASDTMNGTASGAGDPVVIVSTIVGQMTIAGSKIFEVQHYSQSTQSTFGFGVGSSIDSLDEIYTSCEFWKVG